MNGITPQAIEQLTGAFAAIYSVATILSLAFAVLFIIGCWKMFVKAGQPGWKAIIPFYNDYIFYKLCWKTKIFWAEFIFSLAAIISFVIAACQIEPMIQNAAQAIATSNESFINAMMGNVTGLLVGTVLAGIFAIVPSILNIIMNFKISKAYGHGVGFGFGLLFFFQIFILILGFGSSQYVGNPSEKK